MGNSVSSGGCQCVWGYGREETEQARERFNRLVEFGAVNGSLEAFSLSRKDVSHVLHLGPSPTRIYDDMHNGSQPKGEEEEEDDDDDYEREEVDGQEDSNDKQNEEKDKSGNAVGCGWFACPFSNKSTDGLQLVSCLALFSCMSDEEKLEFVFRLFDLERRGSLKDDELFLAIDTCSAAAERFGGFKQITVDDVESLMESLLENSPQGSKESGRLSRFALVHACSVRLNQYLAIFSSVLDRIGGYLPVEDQRGMSENVEQVANDLDVLENQEAGIHLHIGLPVAAAGCTDAFYLTDGELVQVSASIVAIHSQVMDGLSRAPRFFWRHNNAIHKSCFSWESDAFLTASQERICVWSKGSEGYEPCLQIIPKRKGKCTGIAWHGSAFLCLTFQWGAMEIYSIDLENRFSRQVASFPLPESAIHAVSFLSGAEGIVVCGRKGYLEFFNVKTRRRRFGFVRVLASSPSEGASAWQRQNVDFLSCGYHAEGKTLMLGASDGFCYIFDGIKMIRREEAHTGQPILSLQSCARGFCTAGSKDGMIRLWNMFGVPVASFDTMGDVNCLDPGIRSACWSRNGERISVVTKTSELFVLSGVNGANISSPYDEGMPLSAGHVQVSAVYLDQERNLLFTTGKDCTLKMWDAATGMLESTCMLESEGLCLVSAPLLRNLQSLSKQDMLVDPNVIACAIGVVNGVVVVQRDVEKATWTQVFSFTETGFQPSCVALSPCCRFLAVDDRVFDLSTLTLHGMCPVLRKSPENFYFTKLKKRGYWRLHVGDKVFNLVTKSFFRKKGVRETAPAKGANPSKSSKHPSKVPVALAEEQVVEEGKHTNEDEIEARYPPQGDEGKEHNALKRLMFLFAPRLGCVVFLSGHMAIPLNTQGGGRIEPPAELMYESWENSKLQAVQGFRGRKGACLAANEESQLLAYAAANVLVVRKGDQASLHLELMNQIVSLDAVLLKQGRVWRIAVTDASFVYLWDIDVFNFTATPMARFSMKKKRSIAEQVNLSSCGTHVCVTGNEPQPHCVVYSCQNLRSSFCTKPQLPVGYSSGVVDLHKPVQHRFQFLTSDMMASDVVLLVEAKEGTKQYVVHVLQGRKIVTHRFELRYKVSASGGNWLGDEKGNIWEIVVESTNRDDALMPERFRVNILVREAHDGGPVVQLKDRVTLSKKNVVRLWDKTGNLIRVMDCGSLLRISDIRGTLGDSEKIDLVDVWGISRGFVAVDGHRVVKLEDRSTITSTHSKIESIGILRDWKSKQDGTVVMATVGGADASVSLWDKQLRLVSSAIISYAEEDGWCTCCDFSSVGNCLAVGTSTGKVFLLRVPSLELEKELDFGDATEGGSRVESVCWAPISPTADGTFSKEGNRLAVARADKSLTFFSYTFEVIRKPILDLVTLEKTPFKISFADDCEVVKCEDSLGNTVYADSVSANRIPEKHLERNWVCAVPMHTFHVEESVLLGRKGSNPAVVVYDQQQNGENEGVELNEVDFKRIKVVGANRKTVMNFNPCDELVYVAGDCVVGYGAQDQHQRVLFRHHKHAIEQLAFDEFRAGERELAACAVEDEVVVFNMLSNAVLARWKLGRSVSQNLETDKPSALPAEGQASDMKEEKEEEVQDEAEESEAGEDHVPPDTVYRLAMASVESRFYVAALFGDGEKGVQTLALFDSDCDLYLTLKLEESFAHLMFLDGESGKSPPLLGCCTHDGAVKLFESSSGCLSSRSSFRVLEENVEVTACSPRGVLGDSTGYVHFINGQGVYRTLQMHLAPVHAVCVGHQYPREMDFATSDENGDAKMWIGKIGCVMNVQLPTASDVVAMSPLNLILSTRSQIFLRECYSELDRGVFDLPFNGHSKDCTGFELLQDEMRDLSVLYSTGMDATLIKWDMRKLEREDTVPMEENLLDVAFCQDKLFLLVDSVPRRKYIVLDARYYDIMHEASIPSQSISRIVRDGNLLSKRLLLIDDECQSYYSLSADTYALEGPANCSSAFLKSVNDCRIRLKKNAISIILN